MAVRYTVVGCFNQEGEKEGGWGWVLIGKDVMLKAGQKVVEPAGSLHFDTVALPVA